MDILRRNGGIENKMNALLQDVVTSPDSALPSFPPLSSERSSTYLIEEGTLPASFYDSDTLPATSYDGDDNGEIGGEKIPIQKRDPNEIPKPPPPPIDMKRGPGGPVRSVAKSESLGGDVVPLSPIENAASLSFYTSVKESFQS